VRILLIKLRHIGDALILTPTVAALKRQYPQAHVTVVVRQGCQGILAGCPGIDEILVTAAPGQRGHLLEDLRLVNRLRRVGFDYAFELGDNSRGRWLTLLSGARLRAVNAARRPLGWFWRRMFHHVSHWDWKEHHRVEKDYHLVAELLPMPGEIPALQFERYRAVPPSGWNPDPPFVVFHPATRWKRKEWPEERWVALGQDLLATGRRVIVSCGPDPEEKALADRLRASIGEGVSSTEGRLSWAELAWLLHQADLFVGVDTAAMHIASACQCRTVAIFGESRPVSWRPWRVEHLIVGPGQEPPPVSELEARLEFQRHATRYVNTEDVIAAVRRLLSPISGV
jgi:heptosyltransferase-3